MIRGREAGTLRRGQSEARRGRHTQKEVVKDKGWLAVKEIMSDAPQ